MMYRAIRWFILLLLGACNQDASIQSGSSAGSGANTSVESRLSVYGMATYDYVPSTETGLNYAGFQERPIRNAYVEIRRQDDNTILATTTTDDSGKYSFSLPLSMNQKAVLVRIFAKMTNPIVSIVDNTNGQAEYAASAGPFMINGNTVLGQVNAPSGWSGTAYTLPRSAAPFAILDSIYSSVKKVKTARPNVVIPPLKVNWSVNNVAVSGNVEIGEIGTSQFNPNTNQLYILGSANSDTDEYDRHVIAHEWGHFFEHNLSRSDSIGGPHAMGDMKHLSLAFGEGFGNALSAIVFDPDYIYKDTYGAGQATASKLNMEGTQTSDSNPGWFSEASCQEILFDLYDAQSDGVDSVNLGFGPILDVLMNDQKKTLGMTSIFSFINGVKKANPAAVTGIDAILSGKMIQNVVDDYGSLQTYNGGLTRLLPVYHVLNPYGAAKNLSLGVTANGNEADNNRFAFFTAMNTVTIMQITSTQFVLVEMFYKGVRVAYDYAPGGGTVNLNFASEPGKQYTFVLSSSTNYAPPGVFSFQVRLLQ